MSPSDIPVPQMGLARIQIAISGALQSCFERQRAAYLAAPEPNHAQRVEDLNKLAQTFEEHRKAVIEAINQDYGNGSTFDRPVCRVLHGVK